MTVIYSLLCSYTDSLLLLISTIMVQDYVQAEARSYNVRSVTYKPVTWGVDMDLYSAGIIIGEVS